MSLFDNFLECVRTNLESSIYDENTRLRIFERIKQKYKGDEIFKTVNFITDNDDGNEEYKQAAVSGLKCNLGNGSFPLLLHLSREERIMAYRELYSQNSPFSQSEMIGNPINERGRFGRTAIHEAVDAGDLDRIQQLIKEGSDVTVKDNNGSTPFVLAMLNGNQHVVEFLKNLGISQ